MNQLKRLVLALAAALSLMAFVSFGAATSPATPLAISLFSSLYALGAAAILRIGKNRQLSLLTVHSQSLTTGTTALLLPACALKFPNPQYDRKALTHPVMA
jgi:hypothetical protein